MKSKLLFAVLLLFTVNCSAQYAKFLDFAGATNGRTPTGSLISDGPFLYGTAYYGGTNNMGVIFKIKPDGTGYSKLFDFAGAANGNGPQSSLFSDGTYLYGMTQFGGTNNKGVIFKIKPDGTGDTILLHFSGTSNGSYPWGSFVSDGTFLYGMTVNGGLNDKGTIFKIKPDGTAFLKLLDFAGTTNGSGPVGNLIFDGNFLFGMTACGGTNNSCGTLGCGVIFKIMPDGSGYSKLLDFGGANNGNRPQSSLISDGTFLYGMTWGGGTNDLGIIFKMMSDGSGYSKLFDFSGVTSGSNPAGYLFFDGNFLYGMTYNGGTNNDGVIFKIMSDGSGYSKLLDFSGTVNGMNPSGSLISDGNFFYGTTYRGGTSNDGVLFKYGITNLISEKRLFDDFNISPNPSTGIFNLKMSGNENLKILELAIYNVLGEKVYQSSNFQISTQIDLSNQPNGIYFINIKTEQGIVSKKIIIDK